MKFFVDTAEIDQIRELNDLGMVDGVTTNPSLIKKSGRDIIEVTKEICAMVSGPVSAEVTSTEQDEIEDICSCTSNRSDDFVDVLRTQHNH